MRPAFLRLALIALVAMTSTALAQSRRPLREARSDNGDFMLRLDAGRNRAEAPCRATLLRRPEAGQRGETVWQARLVNEIAPEQAFIRDDGRFVVTLNEFRRGGAAHSLVVYDERGQKKAEFTLREVLIPSDWPHVRAREKSVDWTEGAKARFVESPPLFELRLAWDATVQVDLEKFQLVRHDADSPAGGDASDLELPPELAALLGPETDRGLDAGADSEAGGDEPIDLAALAEFAEQIAAAAENLSDDDEHVDPQAALSDQIAAWLKRAADQTDPNFSGLSSERIDEIAASIAEQALANPDSPADIESLIAASPEVAEHIAGRSWESGVAVPMPEPLARVDYVRWFNEIRAQQGVNAAPAFDAAVHAAVTWEGDPTVRDRAMKGDAAALADPAVKDWVAANESALGYLAEGSGADFFSLVHESPDGSMVGILLPALSPLRELSRAAVARGRMLEQQGDVAGAADQYMDIMAAGALTGRGGTMIEHLVGVLMQTQSSEAMLDLLAGDAAKEADLGALAEELEVAYQPTIIPQQTLQYERAMVMDMLQRIYQPDAEGNLAVTPEAVREFLAISGPENMPTVEEMEAQFSGYDFQRMTREVNDYYDQMTDALAAPYPQARDALGQLERQLTDQAATANPVLRSFAPALSRYLANATRGESTRRATQLVAHLQAFRQANGRLPATLDELGSDAAIDPFTNQPFVYRPGDQDFDLYSPGVDGVDQQGAPGADWSEGDLRFWPRIRD